MTWIVRLRATVARGTQAAPRPSIASFGASFTQLSVPALARSALVRTGAAARGLSSESSRRRVLPSLTAPFVGLEEASGEPHTSGSGLASASSPGSLAWLSEEKAPFKLSPKFVDSFREARPPFGFNGLGALVYLRSYARIKDDGSREQWFETVERVVNGTYNMQKRWIEQHQLGWNAWRAQHSAQEMYERIFHMKFLPPGRGLWAMGSPITEEKMLHAALNNCAFVSTEQLRENPSRPFCFLMDAAMLGVGVGFDTKGAQVDDPIVVKGVAVGRRSPERFVVPDSREGWVESVQRLLDSHFYGRAPLDFDYSHIRPAGQPIRGFGGYSSGPEALRQLHADIHGTLTPLAGKPITIRAITDLMNQIGRCVVSGNVRPTAEIAFGDPTKAEFLDLKDFGKNPERAAWGWTSNNSVFASLGMDYAPVCERVVKNGEPGFAWLDNMRNFGRMGDAPNFKDARAMGGNPCLEQTLESYELCCLVETFPSNHESLEDYKRTLKFAYLYAKTVTLGRTHWPLTNRVLLRNRRIGCSMSGIAQFVAKRGLGELQRWCDEGYATIEKYDRRYSDWLAIPRSIKTTCIKPSGTVSLLAGATPGMHYPESRFYLRRVRLPARSDLVPALQDAGYPIEDAVHERDTVIVTIPVDVGEGVRTQEQVSMWEQLSLAAFLQRHWADNQVSCTVTFDPEREGAQLPHALQFFQYQLKGVSFLPKRGAGAYVQMPYEAIDEAEYRRRVAELRPLDISFGRLVATRGETGDVRGGDGASDSRTSGGAGGAGGAGGTGGVEGPGVAEGASGSSAHGKSASSRHRGRHTAGIGFSDGEQERVHQHQEAVPDSFCDADGCNPMLGKHRSGPATPTER